MIGVAAPAQSQLPVLAATIMQQLSFPRATCPSVADGVGVKGGARDVV